jgi:hypothetical protein
MVLDFRAGATDQRQPGLTDVRRNGEGRVRGFFHVLSVLDAKMVESNSVLFGRAPREFLRRGFVIEGHFQ